MSDWSFDNSNAQLPHRWPTYKRVMKPTSIKKISEDELSIIWSDAHSGRHRLESLRDQCPCAECSGETILMRSYLPPPPDRSVPGRYLLKKLQLVGSYAMQITWGDGHSSGIYTWNYLLAHCECEDCGKIKKSWSVDQDSNVHVLKVGVEPTPGLSRTGFWVQRVCRFRHFSITLPFVVINIRNFDFQNNRAHVPCMDRDTLM